MNKAFSIIAAQSQSSASNKTLPYCASIDNASDFANWFIKVHTADSYETAKKLLMMTKGIGNKVADCICLYGLQHFEAYPIDTWMKKLIDDIYSGHFDKFP